MSRCFLFFSLNMPDMQLLKVKNVLHYYSGRNKQMVFRRRISIGPTVFTIALMCRRNQMV